jgi:DNA adenine methylase
MVLVRNRNHTSQEESKNGLWHLSGIWLNNDKAKIGILKSMQRRLPVSNNGFSALKPFLRWAGGKSRIVKVLVSFMPQSNFFNRYFEPFFGSGALFFCVCPNQAILSDLNRDLINCYKEVAHRPVEVWCLLQVYKECDSKEYYYHVRSQEPRRLDPVERAARFIYLNKAAFNGIYRVNQQGKFNVPYGPSFKGPALPEKSLLEAAGKLLKRAKLLAADYREVCESAKQGDFVYLDPPYPPTNGTAYFTHYTPFRFNWSDQQEVSRVFQELDKKGCFVMMSNSDRKEIRLMFQGYNMRRLNIIRWLGSNGNRFRVRELVVTNYNPSKLRREV